MNLNRICRYGWDFYTGLIHEYEWLNSDGIMLFTDSPGSPVLARVHTINFNS